MMSECSSSAGFQGTYRNDSRQLVVVDVVASNSQGSSKVSCNSCSRRSRIRTRRSSNSMRDSGNDVGMCSSLNVYRYTRDSGNDVGMPPVSWLYVVNVVVLVGVYIVVLVPRVAAPLWCTSRCLGHAKHTTRSVIHRRQDP